MPQGDSHRVLLAASEVVGFAKTGGLADVTGSLPLALSRRGHDCAVVLPLYGCARHGKIPVQPTGHTFSIPLGKKQVNGRLWQAVLPDSTVPVYLVEQAEFFERDDLALGRGLYQFTTTAGQKADYPDNCERYIFFCRAVLEAMRLLNFWPDVLHANDWQTGLLPVYVRETCRRLPGHERMRSLFTIHNIAYQGMFSKENMWLTGLDWRLFNYRQLEFYDHLNLLKSGIVFADAVTTVSPSYAKEIQTPYYGCNLQGVLSERRQRLFGINNGVDYGEWNPANDPHLAAPYDENTLSTGKPLCKAALQRHFGLPEQPRTPLLGMVARLVEQKGLDLLAKIVDALIRLDTQFVVLGSGDARHQQMLQSLQVRYPDRVGLDFGFDEALAHQIEAGADMFLMPSLYEPSGLNQMYSMKYGTPPVVRATGGLADTVVDASLENLANHRATGFSFVAYTPEAFLEAVRRAVGMYRGYPDLWQQVMRTAMRQDWSWDRSAAEYEKLYALVRSSL